MKINIPAGILACFIIFAVLFSAGCVSPDDVGGEGTITITDAAGRDVVIPENPSRIAVSGVGSARYFVWLGVTDKIVAVDYYDSSSYVSKPETRPYILANPSIKDETNLGVNLESVNAEKLMTIDPEVLFMRGVSDVQIQNANEITEKTGIPVVLFFSGNYVTDQDKVEESLRLIADILNAEDRAEEIIKYFKDSKADLESRVAGIQDVGKPTVYIGGVGYSGPHGLSGSDPTYFEFTVLNAKNVAGDLPSVAATGYAEISKEQILAWDPDIIFVDLDTLRIANDGAIYELGNDPSYKHLYAVKTGEIYAVNPHTSLGNNHETSIANAYYIGKILYPEQFADIDPEKKADEIYTFIDGAPVFQQLKSNMDGLSYQKVEV